MAYPPPPERRGAPIHDALVPTLVHGLKGIEKESLRIARDGSLSQRPHPQGLGAALTHPHITTDYSEALLELITPALPYTQDMLEFLADLHQYVCTHIGDEWLLASSMPTGDLRDAAIPIAHYGSSNAGRMKRIYRRGLSYRYGRCMQVIAGIHFNYSPAESFWPQYQDLMGHTGNLQAFTTDTYMKMIRNLQRYGWLILYLFGTSPTVSRNFADNRRSPYSSTLEKFDETSRYRPHATSLRMSEIGYLNPVQSMFSVSFNSIDEYMRDLHKATSIPYREYEKIGARTKDGYRQLNTHFLQIENEYYTSVRPKQPTKPNERPLHALAERGIQYVEIRSLDVDPFEPTGIGPDTAHFLEALSLFCLLQPNSGHDDGQRDEIATNALSVANRGREPALVLRNGGRNILLRQWAQELCEEMREICEILDGSDSAQPYTRALLGQMEAIRHPELTPSARVLATMRACGMSFTDFALMQSEAHARYFSNRTLNASVRKCLDLEARTSLLRQTRMEAETEPPFETYLDNYFSQAREDVRDSLRKLPVSVAETTVP
ncbi:glutamate--cysteine ligase [Nitrosovibrio sp. Nv17]|uniref:glutamate--cysteine ligase n=1 Tax=Nitrosovibrio sp. Nv17 TaxID=1855339 RepID=UPI0009087648|nr:glutamate--cysteine ligase [Nitrosovibrio sp. Nv17]SFW16582.1 glutamate-cysteine ligase [Nitrosovibrio sp. Nv17]